jgi:hypothetical protein
MDVVRENKTLKQALADRYVCVCVCVCVCMTLKQALADPYAVYLLYWYKSSNTDAAGEQRSRDCYAGR